MPADRRVKARSEKTDPHQVDASYSRKTIRIAKFQNRGNCSPRAYQRDRKVIRTREGKLRVTVTREAHVAECIHETKIPDREATRRNTWINDHPAMLDEPTDHAVAQTTQRCWRPLANCSGKITHRPHWVMSDHRHRVAVPSPTLQLRETNPYKLQTTML